MGGKILRMKKFLIAIGRPIYLLLSYLVIGLLYFLYFVGHGANQLPTLIRGGLAAIRRQLKLRKTFAKKIAKIRPGKAGKFKFQLPQIRFPQLRVPKLKLKLPHFRFRLPKLGFKKFRLRFSPNFKAIITIGIILLIFWELFLKGLPSAGELITRNQQVSTKIFDRNGVLLYTIYKDQNRSPIALAAVPQSVRLATLAAEDAEFYTHPGFSIKGIIRSAISNAARGELSGGSTITQQLVKNALLSPEKTFTRKIKEIILSVETELTFSKDQILEMYLNEVSYGGTAYGIEQASEQYFGKKAGELTLAQAAYLAGLPKSPTKYSPYGSDPKAGVDRQHEVLKLMRVNKFITKEQEDEALNEELKFLPNKADIKAPHFVMYVRQILVDKYGEEVVEKGGLEVVTTLDYEIQKMAEEVVKNQVNRAKGLRVGNGAAVVLNPATGEILAMVGSKDYFDTAADGQVNVTTSLRQPGSSIKVVNYLYGLMHGYTAGSILNDSPVSFVIAGQPAYVPKNYDNKFRGKLTLRSALAESRNIPAVRLLASYGVDKMIEFGTQMGITTWTDPSRYGLSLTLGGGEVKLVDLARVFATIADYGKRPEIGSIVSIKNYKGETLEKNDCIQGQDCRKEVADAKASFILIDILKDNLARSPAFGANSNLVIPGHPEVAVKTGTSNDLKDNLTVGFNQKYLVAVWVGNNDGSPMSRIASGITGAAPIFNEIMKKLLATEPSVPWQAPEGVIQLRCNGRTEWFIKGTEPANYCTILEEIKKSAEEKAKQESRNGSILDTGASTAQ